MRDEHVRAQPGPPDCSIQGASLGGEGLPSAPPPQRAPLTSWGGPSALPQMRGGTPCVCLCFAAHSQPWACSHTAWHPWVCFCTPTHTCARSHTALHTCVHTCACSRTALHALTRLPRRHSLAHPCTLSHTRTCSCTPMHTLSRALHACAPSPTAWHTCTHTCTCLVHFLYTSCTLLHALPQPCTLFHSLNALTALHTCAFHPLCTLSPPPCTLSPRCALWPSPGAVAHTLHVAPSSCSRTSLVPLPSPGRPCTLHTFLHAHTQHSLVATAPGGPLWLHTPPWVSSLCPPQLVWADAPVPQGPARDAARC